MESFDANGNDAPGLETHHLSENQDVWARVGKTEHAAKVLVPPRAGDASVAIRWSGNLEKAWVSVGTVRPMHSPEERRRDDATDEGGGVRERRTRRSRRRTNKPDRLGSFVNGASARELRAELETRGLKTRGSKSDLSRRVVARSQKAAPAPRQRWSSAVDGTKTTGRSRGGSTVQGCEVAKIRQIRESKRAKELALRSQMKTVLHRPNDSSRGDDDDGGGNGSASVEGGEGIFLGSRHVEASPFPTIITVETTTASPEETGEDGDGEDDDDRRNLSDRLVQRHRSWEHHLAVLESQIADLKRTGSGGANYSRECEEERVLVREKLKGLSDRIARLRHLTSPRFL